MQKKKKVIISQFISVLDFGCYLVHVGLFWSPCFSSVHIKTKCVEMHWGDDAAISIHNDQTEEITDVLHACRVMSEEIWN